MQKVARVLMVLLIAFLPFLGQMTPNGDARLLDQTRGRDFQGVLDVWFCETFAPGKGSLLGWVNQAVQAYEKENPGVYVRVRTMRESVIRERLDDKRDLPDAILCGGGIVTAQDALQICESSCAPVYTQAVSLGEHCYAYPAAVGAYTVLYQKKLLAQAGIESANADSLLSLAQNGCSVLLCGYDRLTCPAAALERLMPQAQEALFHETYGRRTLRDAWADFVLDQTSVGYVCTQKEVFRIRTLLAGGSAFEWDYDEIGCAYTDQLLALYVPDTGQESARAVATHLFAQVLQRESIQEKLKDYGAFSVLNLPLYPPDTCMGAMQSGLMQENLFVPNQLFWREQAKTQFDMLKNAHTTQEVRAAAQEVLSGR